MILLLQMNELFAQAHPHLFTPPQSLLMDSCIFTVHSLETVLKKPIIDGLLNYSLACSIASAFSVQYATFSSSASVPNAFS